MKMRNLQLRANVRFLMIAIMLWSIGTTKGYSVEIGNLKYSLNSNTLKATVIGHINGATATGSVIIPETVSYDGLTYIVSEIGHGAFQHCSNLNGTLVIPNTVTYIHNYAFQGCSGLRGSLTIPNSVQYVSESAFYDCSGFNGSLVIGSSVVSLGARAFYGCNGFTQIASKKGPNPPSASSNTFSGMNFNITVCVLEGCSSAYQSATGWNQFTNYQESLYYYDFSAISSSGQMLYYQIIDETNHYVELCHPNSSFNNPWEGYEMPSGEITIPTNVSYDGITYLVRSIGKFAFKDCHDMTGSLILPNSVTTIDGGAFYGCSGFTGNLVIPNTVTTLGGSAFQGCSGFTGELVIPNSLSIIRGAVFSGCTGLSGSLSFPSSVHTIQSLAFENCSGFNGELTIENTVTTIGYGAFKGCSGFTAVYYDVADCTNTNSYLDYPPFQGCGGMLELGENVERIPNYMFYKASFTGNLSIPSSVTELGMYAFSKCSGFTGDLIIPNTVSSIGHAAFYGCNGFNGQLVIPNTWTEIAPSAFSGCSGLSGNLVIPNTIAYIGTSAFSGCSGFMGTLSIPNSVETIGYGAFSNCSGFTGLSIPNTVSIINEYTFGDCSGLSFVIIPNSITRISNEAFENCTSLTSITIPSSVSSIGWWAFDNTGWYNNQPDGVLYLDDWCLGYKGVEMNPNVEIQEGTIHIADGAFMNNRELSSITLPNSLVTIGSLAFEMCEHLASVSFGNSLTSIGNNAFSSCSELNAVELPNSLLRIEDRAFLGSGLHSVVIPDAVNYIGESAFEFCYMRNLTLGSSVTTIGNDAFGQCEGLRNIVSLSFVPPTVCEETFNMVGQFNTVTLYVPENAINDYQSAPVWSGFEIVLPITQNGGFDFTYNHLEGSAKVIGYHGEAETLNIPSSVTCNGIAYPVTSIGDWAFSDNQHIQSVSFPDDITIIGDAAFYNCNNLSGDLVIPNTVESIGRWAFSYCRQIESVLIGNSVASIGARAFDECYGLGLVIFGNSMTSIGGFAFSGCSKIKEIWSIRITPPSCESYAFMGININIPVYVPCGAQSDYESASRWSTFTNYHETPSCLVVKTSSGLLGNAHVVQYGNCDDNESIVHAEPYYGAVFTGWTANGLLVSEEYDYTFPLTEDVVLVANFEQAASHCNFIGGGTTNHWSDIDNWEPKVLPTENSTVGIWADVAVDCNVSVNSIAIHDNNAVTILSQKALAVSEEIISPTASSLIVKDGGELIHSCNDVLATIEKTIPPYTEGENNGWNLIASPLSGNQEVSSIDNLTDGDYDLYYYDEQTITWINHKETDMDFHQFASGEGYLYGNKGERIMRYGFDQGLEGWTTIGSEGNASSWHHVSNDYGSHSGEGHVSSAISYHYVNGNYYSDDDYLVSPLVLFTSTSTISFWVYNSDWLFEHFGVAVSINSNVDVSDFTTIQEWMPNAKTGREEVSPKENRAAGGWYCYTVDLSQYEGQMGYVAIRHYECTDIQHTLRVDDIELGGMDNLRSSNELYFVGEVENGSSTINIPLSYTETAGNLKGFNLVGNPFVHNVTTYGSANVANGCFQMNENGSDLIVSEISEANPLKPAEGFFVKATGENASITFNPQRGASMAKSNSIRIEVLKDNKLVDRLIVKDSEGHSLEKFNLNEKRTQVFAVQGQKEVAIVPCEGNEQPFSFKVSKNGNYTINVDADNMEFTYLHLIDNLTGNEVNLLLEPSYTFEAKTTDYASRFKLVFNANVEDGPSTGSGTFAFINGSGNLTIYGIEGEATLQVLDVLGHVLSSEQFSGSYEKKLNVAPGVYMLRLIHGDDVKVQKIVVR